MKRKRFFRHSTDNAEAALHLIVKSGTGRWEHSQKPHGGRPVSVMRLLNESNC